MLKRLYLLLLPLVLTGIFSAALASDTTPSISEQIIAFFNQAERTDEQATPMGDMESPELTFMRDVVDAVVTSDSDRLTQLVKDATDKPVPAGTSWEQTLQFARGLAEIMPMEVASFEDRREKSQRLIDYIADFETGDNWYIQSTGHSLTAFIHVTLNETLVAANQLDRAMAIIPTEISGEATAARLLASEVAMVLHGLQGNPAFMLEAAELQRQAKAEIGETLNRYELMTNFVYALNRSRDFESAAEVADLLMDEPRDEDSIPGLAEVYMAETFNEVGQYRKARRLAETTHESQAHPVVAQRSFRELIVALAGIGEANQVETMLASENLKFSPEQLLETVNEQFVLHAEALLAMHRGESELSLALMKRRADLLIDRVQSANSGNMTAMLSNLENTRGRQLERENALQREAELKAVQLEQQEKMNRLLWALIGVLTIAFNLLLIFLRYREKLSSKVHGLQKEALSAEKMKTEFLGVINHELRTPLNGIIGISDAMIHRAKDPVEKSQAEAVQESGQLLFDLLDSLITMSTIEGDRLSLDSEVTDLAEIITDEAGEWTKAANTKGLTYTVFVAPELGNAVLADGKRVRQCLRFLLSNAMRFTHQGRVHLHATAEPGEDGQLDVKIVVADTGQGMSEDVQDRLFKPFLQADAYMTRKYGGAGLSLAIGRKLARMMDGDLTVTSREGRGSEFVFTASLTRADAPAHRLEVDANGPGDPAHTSDQPDGIVDLMAGDHIFKSEPVHRPVSGLSVMIADAGTEAAKAFQQELKALHCRVEAVRSGAKLIKQVEDHNPDLVVLDMETPEIDAASTVTQLRKISDQRDAMMIILLTCGENPGAKAKLFSAGADMLLEKPVQPEQLTEALNQARSLRRAA